jgi:ketosteroid isomerase-like protein
MRSETTGVVIVTKMFEEWDAHDLDAVYARLTDDYREYANGVLVKNGRLEARAADAALYEMIPDYGRTVDELWGLDDRVVARFVIHGTMSGGKRFDIAVGCVYGLRDGQISEAHLYFDPTNALAAD